jgi:2-dehydro-3-deoxyphosphogluconate aldolase/(4S)-4-hydroxy-2-oxoglutarate aldolase
VNSEYQTMPGNSPKSRPLPRFSVEDHLVAVLRAPRPDACAAIVDRLVESGIRCIELTLTTPDALRELPRLRERVGDSACIGMGTVTSEANARASLDAGAEFLVTPIVAPAVLALGVAAGVPVLCGALTPTEAHAAWSAGASAVKIFPASAVRPSYLRELRGPFPDLDAMPSGGVGFDDIVPWLAAGACAVSLGGSLIGDVFAEASSDLEGRAQRARDAVTERRAG